MDKEVVYILEEANERILRHHKSKHLEFDVLRDIKQSLDTIERCWRHTNRPESIVISTHFAEALLSVLEAKHTSNHQCGGFDCGQKDRSLNGRYEWIKKVIETKLLKNV